MLTYRSLFRICCAWRQLQATPMKWGNGMLRSICAAALSAHRHLLFLRVQMACISGLALSLFEVATAVGNNMGNTSAESQRLTCSNKIDWKLDIHENGETMHGVVRGWTIAVPVPKSSPISNCRKTCKSKSALLTDNNAAGH